MVKNSKVYLIASLIFLTDLISKTIVINSLTYGKNTPIINNFFYLTYVKNTGGAFSILNNNVYLLAIIGIIILVLFINYISKHNLTKIETISYSFVLGGLLGNLFDRIIRGGVVDFLNFYIFDYNFPIFNISDIFIVCGIILIICIELGVIRNESRERKHKN